jgi:hypothetical protein
LELPSNIDKEKEIRPMEEILMKDSDEKLSKRMVGNPNLKL